MRAILICLTAKMLLKLCVWTIGTLIVIELFSNSFFEAKGCSSGIPNEKTDGIVNLNVGGCLCTTTRSTLTRYPDSMLAAMFSGELDPSVCDDNGAYVIDGDWPIFRHVLNFLRRGKLILSEDFKEWDLLASEADYYQIEALVEAVKAEKCRRDATRSVNVGGYKYTMNLSALTRYPDSMLAAMFSGEFDPPVLDESRAYVIDGDGPIFRHVLNFLRRGRLILPEDFKEWDLLASEADFYQIPDLVAAASSRKEELERPPVADSTNMEYVELTEMIYDKCKYRGSWETLKQLPRKFLVVFEADLDPFISQSARSMRSLEDMRSSVQRFGEILGYWGACSIQSSGFGRETRRPQLDSPNWMEVFQRLSELGFQLLNPTSAPEKNKWLFGRKT